MKGASGNDGGLVARLELRELRFQQRQLDAGCVMSSTFDFVLICSNIAGLVFSRDVGSFRSDIKGALHSLFELD